MIMMIIGKLPSWLFDVIILLISIGIALLTWNTKPIYGLMCALFFAMAAEFIKFYYIMQKSIEIIKLWDPIQKLTRSSLSTYSYGIKHTVFMRWIVMKIEEMRGRIEELEKDRYSLSEKDSADRRLLYEDAFRIPGIFYGLAPTETMLWYFKQESGKAFLRELWEYYGNSNITEIVRIVIIEDDYKESADMNIFIDIHSTLGWGIYFITRTKYEEIKRGITSTTNVFSENFGIYGDEYICEAALRGITGIPVTFIHNKTIRDKYLDAFNRYRRAAIVKCMPKDVVRGSIDIENILRRL